MQIKKTWCKKNGLNCKAEAPPTTSVVLDRPLLVCSNECRFLLKKYKQK